MVFPLLDGGFTGKKTISAEIQDKETVFIINILSLTSCQGSIGFQQRCSNKCCYRALIVQWSMRANDGDSAFLGNHFHYYLTPEEICRAS